MPKGGGARGGAQPRATVARRGDPRARKPAVLPRWRRYLAVRVAARAGRRRAGGGARSAARRGRRAAAGAAAAPRVRIGRRVARSCTLWPPPAAGGRAAARTAACSHRRRRLLRALGRGGRRQDVCGARGSGTRWSAVRALPRSLGRPRGADGDADARAGGGGGGEGGGGGGHAAASAPRPGRRLRRARHAPARAAAARVAARPA